MEADISQIKMLLWIILGLQVFFIASNILCRILGCGESSDNGYQKLLEQDRIEELLEQTRKRLDTHPRDIDALYFRVKALLASGLAESAREHLERLMLVEPSLAKVCKGWLDVLDEEGSEGVKRLAEP